MHLPFCPLIFAIDPYHDSRADLLRDNRQLRSKCYQKNLCGSRFVKALWYCSFFWMTLLDLCIEIPLNSEETAQKFPFTSKLFNPSLFFYQRGFLENIFNRIPAFFLAWIKLQFSLNVTSETRKMKNIKSVFYDVCVSLILLPQYAFSLCLF